MSGSPNVDVLLNSESAAERELLDFTQRMIDCLEGARRLMMSRDVVVDEQQRRRARLLLERIRSDAEELFEISCTAVRNAALPRN